MLTKPLRSASQALKRHRSRHTASGFDCVLADRVGYLNAADWDRLVSPISVFMSRRYLSVLEHHHPANVVGRYAMVYRDNEPMAAIAAQRVTLNPHHISVQGNSKRRRFIRHATSRLKDLSQQMLVCGNLMSWGNHGIAMAANADESVMSGVAEALYRMRSADRLLGNADLIMIKDFTAELDGFIAPLRTYSYRRVNTEPNMVLTIDPKWATFDDYLAALNSGYRKNVKKVCKEFEAAGMTLRRISPTESNAPALHALYLQVHDAAAVRLFTLPPSYFAALQSALGDQFCCTAAYQGETMVGFITCVNDGPTAVAYYIGFDRTTNNDTPVYFRLLYQAIDDAIAWQCRSISFGRTALEPKARLGAKPQPMSVYVRHRVPMLNMIVRAAAQAVHHDEAPDREPFKST